MGRDRGAARMETIMFLLLMVLLLLCIIALIGAMILLYDAVLDVIEERHRKRDRERRKP